MDELEQAFQTIRALVAARESNERDVTPEAIAAGLTILETFFRDIHDIAENARGRAYSYPQK